MKPVPFAILATVTAAVVGAAVYAVVVRTAETAPEVTGGTPLIAGLGDQINQVVELTVSGRGGSVTIARLGPDSDRWTVTEKANYPAALQQVRRTLLALKDARTLEPRTLKPEQYGKLDVDDAGATRVALRTADGQTLPVLLVGKTVASVTPEHPVHQFYARRAGEAQSWLAEGELPQLATDPMPWVDRTLPTLVGDRVMAVTVSRSGAPSLTVVRTEPGQHDFTVEGLPEGAKPKQAKVNELATAADFLSFEDVAKRDPAGQSAAESAVTTLRAFDGEVLTVHINWRDGKPWADVSAELDPVQAAKGGARPAAGAAGAPNPAQEVKDVQERTAAWSYRLPDYLAKALAPRADDLTEKANPPANAPQPSAASEPTAP